MTAEMASSRALVSTMGLTNSNSCLHLLMFLAMILARSRLDSTATPASLSINGMDRLALDFDSAGSYRTKPDIGRLAAGSAGA